MRVFVDVSGLIARSRSARSDQTSENDAWCVIDGFVGAEALAIVEAACGPVRDRVEPFATITGTFLRLWDANWLDQCRQIAQHLEQAGYTGSIGVPPTPPRGVRFSHEVLPAMLLVHRLDPPVEIAPPLGPDGHGYHWTLSPEARQRRLDAAIEWALEPGQFGTVGDIRVMPVTREDAAEKLEGYFGTIFSAYLEGLHPDQTLSHHLDFRDWGVSHWTADSPGPTQLSRALGMREVLVALATDVTTGFIGLASMGKRGVGGLSLTHVDRSDHLPYPPTSDSRFWHRYVGDSFAIQLLNEEHLTKAHDLTDWSIEEVAPGRYLTQARDLQPWFDWPSDKSRLDRSTHTFIAVPKIEILTKARHDFGAMIATREDIDHYYQRRRP